eukprot:1160704-Pelagomonas_calceolata.AAC.1
MCVCVRVRASTWCGEASQGLHGAFLQVPPRKEAHKNVFSNTSRRVCNKLKRSIAPSHVYTTVHALNGWCLCWSGLCGIPCTHTAIAKLCSRPNFRTVNAGRKHGWATAPHLSKAAV